MQPFTSPFVSFGATVGAGVPFNAGFITAFVGGNIMGMSVSLDNNALLTVNRVIIGIGQGGVIIRNIAAIYCANDNSPQYIFDYRGGEDKGGLRIATNETILYVQSDIKAAIDFAITLTIWPP